MRYALLHSVFLPILRESFRTCGARSVGFYEDGMMAAILEYLGREVDGEGEVIVVEEALVMKLVHVRIMEGILQVPKSELPDSLAESSKQVMKYIYSHILKSNSQFPQSAYASYLNIQLHTAAYVVTCVWICNTNIFSSSLADDVTRHDFTSTKMLVPSTITSSNQTVTLELDEINRHDAMQVLTAVLNHLMENVVTPDSLCSAPEKCTWFDSFLSCLEMPGQDKNVRVWLIKLVINCADLFQYFADRLYPALFRIIASGILGSHMNYFLNDLLLVMLRWHSTSLPPPEIVHDFLAFIFQLVPNPRPAILKYNLEMIRYKHLTP
ncbi:DNA-dependent protein kinase catalytic subunit-like [Diaphorina citri]|uniref:DNA-dependent protein kinase catalytic subunit-like n=1 Tax=Diaphorina citri TaxID=121845 RepID=A0A3Q0J6X1_DIACI|nr:DNA-dependent protein kinase catalytic subunit-like [Diaphorina citri]